MENNNSTQTVKGVPVIFLGRNCFYCSSYIQESKECKKGRGKELMRFAGVFCPDLGGTIEPPAYFSESLSDLRYDILNRHLYKEDSDETIIEGEVFIIDSSESPSYQHPFPGILRELRNQEWVSEKLKKLESIDKSSKEARKLRRELRKKGFNLRPKERR